VSDIWVVKKSNHNISNPSTRRIHKWITASPGVIKLVADDKIKETEPRSIYDALRERYKNSGGVMLYCPCYEYV